MYKIRYAIRYVRINKGYISKIASTITGGVYAFLGFVGTLVPLDEILPDESPIWIRCIISILILIAIWGVVFIVVSIYMTFKKRFKVFSANNGHALYLQYGDIFDKNEVMEPNKRRNIVISVNRCFDTHVGDHIVSEQSVHGAVLKHLYESGNYTEGTLSKSIDKLLKGVEYESLSEKEKPKGSRKRYPLGTVIDLPGCENEHFFLWALSTFDSNLKAQTSMQEYALAVQKLIESCNADSEGFPVVIPLVGAGLSRTKKDQQAILKYLINAFRINGDEINSDIHIVIREDMKNDISIMNMK